MYQLLHRQTRQKCITLMCVLVCALLARAGVAAMMPVQMLGAGGGHTSTASQMPEDCPGHAAMHADGADSTASASPNCAWCGECCASAPISIGFDASQFLEAAPRERFREFLLPKVSFLTPGLYRPPAL